MLGPGLCVRAQNVLEILSDVFAPSHEPHPHTITCSLSQLLVVLACMPDTKWIRYPPGPVSQNRHMITAASFCICVCKCAYIYIYIYTHTHMMLYVYILTHTHTFSFMMLSLYNMYVNTHTHTQTHTYKPVHESGLQGTYF